jgi:hypothetical protein
MAHAPEPRPDAVRRARSGGARGTAHLTGGQGRALTGGATQGRPQTHRASRWRTAERPTTDLGAYDLYLRALAAFYPITKERVVEALGLLEQAIGIDRHYGPALTWAAVCHLQLVTDGWAEAPETNRRKAIDLARQALQVGGNDPGILPTFFAKLHRLCREIIKTGCVAGKESAIHGVEHLIQIYKSTKSTAIGEIISRHFNLEKLGLKV